MRVDKRRLIRVLSQRSTVVGIVGVIGAVFALFEIPISAEQELKIVEGLLLLVSLVAIITKEEEPYAGIDRRVNSGEFRDGRPADGIYQQARKSEGETKR